MKKYLFLSLIIFGIILFPYRSQAAIIFDNRSVGTSTLISDGGGVGYMNLFLGQASSSIATTTLYYSYWAGYSSLISFVRCDTQVTGLFHTDLADGSTPWGYDNFTVGNRFLTTDGLAVNVTGTITTSIIAGKYYFLQPPSVISSNDYGCVAYGDGDGSTFNANNVYTGGTFNSCLADDPTSCYVGSAPPSLSILYPTNNSTVAPFNNFVFGVTGADNTHNYQLKVQNQIPQAIPPYNYVSSNLGGNYLNQFSVLIPWNSAAPLNTFATSTWLVTAQLYDQTQCDITQDPTICSTPVATVTSTYDLYPLCNALGCLDKATTTYNQIGHDSTSTVVINQTTYNAATNSFGAPAQAACANASSTGNIVGDGLVFAGCQLGVFFLTPHTAVVDAFQTQIDTSKTRFPISILFNFADVVSSTINGSSTASTTLSLTFPSLYGAPTTTFVIMSPTILTDSGVSQDFKDMYFAIARKTLWLTTAIGAVIIPFM